MRRRMNLLRWFAVGFLVAFFGMLFTSIVSMHPSGQHAVRGPLWHYYAREIPRWWNATYKSEFDSAFLSMLGEHFLVSLIAGAVAMLIGWMRLKWYPRTTKSVASSTK